MHVPARLTCSPTKAVLNLKVEPLAMSNASSSMADPSIQKKREHSQPRMQSLVDPKSLCSCGNKSLTIAAKCRGRLSCIRVFTNLYVLSLLGIISRSESVSERESQWSTSCPPLQGAEVRGLSVPTRSLRSLIEAYILTHWLSTVLIHRCNQSTHTAACYDKCYERRSTFIPILFLNDRAP